MISKTLKALDAELYAMEREIVFWKETAKGWEDRYNSTIHEAAQAAINQSAIILNKMITHQENQKDQQ